MASYSNKQEKKRQIIPKPVKLFHSPVHYSLLKKEAEEEKNKAKAKKMFIEKQSSYVKDQISRFRFVIFYVKTQFHGPFQIVMPFY